MEDLEAPDAVHQTTQARDEDSQQQQQKKKSRAWQETIRSCRSLLVVFLAFCVCWLPYAVMIAVDLNDQLPMPVHLWVTWLAHLHSSINWIIYLITNSSFR